MNWSKAKTILIIALIVCNLFLLQNYLSIEQAEEDRIIESTESAVEYIENQGIKVNCEIPKKTMSLPVITVKLYAGDSAGGLCRIDVDGTALELWGVSDAESIELITKTDNEIEVLPAYTALLKSLESINDEIDGIELIYFVDRAAYAGEAGEDTALPYWKVSSGTNSYYYSAFSE